MLRVLIVEDEPLIRWSLAETLVAAGHVAIEAEDGATAIRVASPDVDVILLDYRLPDSNDLTLLSTLRRAAPDTAVVMMTAHSTPEMMSGALRLGVQKVLHKPIEMGDIPDVVAFAQRSRPI